MVGLGDPDGSGLPVGLGASDSGEGAGLEPAVATGSGEKSDGEAPADGAVSPGAPTVLGVSSPDGTSRVATAIRGRTPVSDGTGVVSGADVEDGAAELSDSGGELGLEEVGLGDAEGDGSASTDASTSEGTALVVTDGDAEAVGDGAADRDADGEGDGDADARTDGDNDGVGVGVGDTRRGSVGHVPSVVTTLSVGAGSTDPVSCTSSTSTSSGDKAGVGSLVAHATPAPASLTSRVTVVMTVTADTTKRRIPRGVRACGARCFMALWTGLGGAIQGALRLSVAF